MKQRNLKTTFMLLAAFAATSCSNETDPTLNPNANPDAVELGITAGVELTKSVIDGGTNAQSGTGANILQEVAVRATGDDYTSGKSNDKAIYSQSSGAWTSGNDKIYLTAKVATIYAFHPVYTYDTNGNKTSTAVTVAGTVGSGATIPVTLFTGGDTESGSPTLKANSTITDADNSSTKKILSAPGEVDYLWEGSDTKPTASNGKASDATTTKSVELNMKHALSMVSFKIYKDATYKGDGLLTKIVLKNKDNGTALKAEGATMNIETGAVTVTGTTGATFTRLIKASNSVDGATLASTVDNAHSYSILVFPDAKAVAKNTIQAVFTIDGADYMKELAANTTGVQWEAGKNNTYTVKLSGTGLTIGTVKVAAWTSETGGNMEIN